MRGPKKRLTPFGKMVVKALADRDMSRGGGGGPGGHEPAVHELHPERDTLG